VIGNGVVVHIRGLLEELDSLTDAGVDYSGRIHISDRAHIVFDFHQSIDALNESHLGDNKLGTTKKGIGPCYSSKTMRNGLRVGDLRDMVYFEKRLRSLASQLERANPGLIIDVDKEIEYYRQVRGQIIGMTTDTISYTHDALKAGKSILAEGANATSKSFHSRWSVIILLCRSLVLDLDFGTYPFVTSSNPSIGSVCTGLGVPPQSISGITGIVKAYCTRVGEGPFPTELHDETNLRLRSVGGEFGTTTGRPRRCGWIDIPQLKYASMINGFTDINLTKVDVLTGFEEIKIGARYKIHGQVLDSVPASLTTYGNAEIEYEVLPGWSEDISQARTFDELPENCKRFILRVEELLGVPVRWIGVGAGRDDMIQRF
jgi:adenylosuccinate synthase